MLIFKCGFLKYDKVNQSTIIIRICEIQLVLHNELILCWEFKIWFNYNMYVTSFHFQSSISPSLAHVLGVTDRRKPALNVSDAQ